MFNKYKKITDAIQWKYFVGEYKPKQQEKLERLFKTLTGADKNSAKEMRILFDNFENDDQLKNTLGVNPYNVYSIGTGTFVNFRDIKNIVVYKVVDLSQSSQLFGDKLARGVKKLTADQINKKLKRKMPEWKNYLKNFGESYLIIKLPNHLDDEDLSIKALAKENELDNIQFVEKTNSMIFEIN